MEMITIQDVNPARAFMENGGEIMVLRRAKRRRLLKIRKLV